MRCLPGCCRSSKPTRRSVHDRVDDAAIGARRAAARSRSAPRTPTRVVADKSEIALHDEADGRQFRRPLPEVEGGHRLPPEGARQVEGGHRRRPRRASISRAPNPRRRRKGPLWFNTAKFPVAHFASTSIRDLGGDRYEVAGKLSLKGITRDCVVPIAVQADAAGQPRRRGHVSDQAARVQGRRGRMGRHRRRSTTTSSCACGWRSLRRADRWNSVGIDAVDSGAAAPRRCLALHQPHKEQLRERSLYCCRVIAALNALPAPAAGNVCDRPRAFAAAVGGASHRLLQPASASFGKVDRQGDARSGGEEGLGRRHDRCGVGQDVTIRRGSMPSSRASSFSTWRSTRRSRSSRTTSTFDGDRVVARQRRADDARRDEAGRC